MKYWFKNVADNIYIYPKSAPRNLILQTRTSDCNSADVRFDYDKYSIYLRGIENLYRILMNYYENIEDM